MLRKSLTVLFFFLSSFSSIAGFRTNVHSISRREGLSNGAVNTIVKDSEGYIWFGTWNGLNKYNGSNIITYLPGRNSSSIHNHVIRELYPAASGLLWILTNKGVGLYDNIHDRFTPFFAQESEQMNYENDIALCYSDSYGALVSVLGRGIFSFDSTKMQFNKLIFDKFSLSASLNIKRVHLIGNMVYCISGSGQLMKISGNKLEDILQLPITGTLSSSMALQINQRPYMLITQRNGAAFMVDLGANQVQTLKIPDDVITSFSVSKVKDRLWAGTEKGKIYSFNLINHDFVEHEILTDQSVRNPIATRILSIYESDSDELWIGTDGNGVYTLKLIQFPTKSLASNQLSYPIVRSILVTRKQDLLIGTKGGGIDIFDVNGNHIRELSVKNGLSNNSVLSFHERDDGSIWVGTDGKGVDIISPDYHTIRNFPRDFKEVNPLNFASVYRILEESSQRIYLGTSGSGVIMVELDSKNQLPVNCEQLILDRSVSVNSPQKQIVYALAEQKPGLLWIGTRGLGAYLYNTTTKNVISQYSTVSHPDIIKNDDILAAYSNLKGPIWIGSSNGIFSLLPGIKDSDKVGALNIPDDLSNTSIHAIERDNLGGIWVTTNQGIALIDSSRRNVRNFNVNDGLINYEYSDGASWFDQSTARLYAGGTMGVDIIQTDEIKFSSYFPPIAINQLLVRNIPADIGNESVLTSRINLQKSLKLKYNQNTLTFYVSPLAYWGQERFRISYRLVNFNDEWIVNPENLPISFSNLEPGKYSLQIRVSDENGNWSKNIRNIELVIDPPFWKTPWAIAAYIFFLIGVQLLIFAFYRNRVARKKEAALLEFQQKKEEELQKYKIEFFTNVAHEFRTPLTLITSHIHALLEDSRNLVENPRILKVYNNSIKLQKLVLEIMQFRKLEKGKEPLNIQLTKPYDLIVEVISDLELFAQKTDIRCEIIASDPQFIFKTDADKFQRIITNLISNAIKYNRQGGFVKVVMNSDQSALSVEIEDSGMGIKPEFFQRVFEPFGISSASRKGSFPDYRSTGLGLAVTKGLVELLKGTIDFESRFNEGTKFSCLFPDINELSDNPLINESSNDPHEINFIEEANPDQAIGDPDFQEDRPLILLVDDEPEILILLRDFLQKDYNLIFAQDGREAYDKVLSQKPDLIISDVMMPDMDGIELCSQLRENFDTSHLPLILLTAKAEIEDRIAGLKAGADSYIPKPFHSGHLKIRIEKLLQLRLTIKSHFGRQVGITILVEEIPDPFFQKLLSYIDQNIDDETLSAEILCDKLAISKSSLYNKTKSILGTTPHGLINQRRLSKASMLLKSTNITVNEIIDQTGFTSRTHFYELFNKAFSCSPSEFRKKLDQS